MMSVAFIGGPWDGKTKPYPDEAIPLGLGARVHVPMRERVDGYWATVMHVYERLPRRLDLCVEEFAYLGTE